MSALRRLTSSFRSERRSEQACPYSRPQPSPPKPKPTRRPRYWDFFNFFSFLAPYSDEEEEEAKKEAEAKAKANNQVEGIVVPEQDSEMSDASASASSTEESTTTTSDTSLETVETAVTAEHTELVGSTKHSEQDTRISEPAEPVPLRSVMSEVLAMSVEPVIPSQPIESTSSVSSQPPVPSVPEPPQSSTQRTTTTPVSTYSSPTPSFLGSTTVDEILEWARLKFESGTPMNDMDVLGLKAYLDRTRGECTYEPIKLRFPRFTSPSAISPAVDPAPSTSLPTFKNNVPSRPPRVLKKDPNGTYVWRGAGTARSTPEESRKRRAPPVIIPRFDPYKRRRLFEEARGPPTTTTVPTSESSQNSTESVPLSSPKPTRITLNRLHATPHAPSPLRNVISGSPPPSSATQARTIPTNLNATSSGTTPANQTASAAFLQEVVEKVIPRRPRYSDVVNPYQTAAPVKPVIKPMEKKRMSDRRARTKEAEKQREATKVKEAEKRELTAKEIIEATVPKGVKRSRPPPGLAKSKGANVVSGTTSKRVLEEPEERSIPAKKRRTVTVEEVSEEENPRAHSHPVRPNVIIESRTPSPEPIPAPCRPSRTNSPTAKERSAKEVPRLESSVKVPNAKEQGPKSQPSAKVLSSKESSTRTSSKSSSAKGPSNHFSPLLNSKVTGKSSVPREPSKLRTSFLPDECENEEPKMASPTPSAIVTMTTPGTPLADIQEKKDPKEVALTLPLNDLPSFIFKTPPALMAGDHTDARVAAKELPVTSLPKFDFSKARAAMNGVIFPAVPIPTIKPFDFESAGVIPKTLPGNDQWQCPTCMLQNSVSAVEKCSICEAPRPGAENPKKTVVNGINGANDSKKLSGVNGKTPSSRSKSTHSTSPDVKVFDFAAAGLTPKMPVATGQWTCPTCMLQNPPTAIEKCKVCDSPRPGVEKTEKEDKAKKPYLNGTTHSSNNLTDGISLSTVKSFDFAAAGIFPKAPSTSGNWYCPTCMLQNPVTALEKCKVCDSPRPGMEKKVAPLPMVPVKSISQLVPKSFDWAGAGLVPKFNGSSWTCGTCMLSNPPTETEKCKICDASRS
ncbi:hypothetical protein ACEPAF_668 [Sanghuangporus sanghuang]